MTISKSYLIRMQECMDILTWRKHTSESIGKARNLQCKTHLELCDPDNKLGIVYKNGIYLKVA